MDGIEQRISELICAKAGQAPTTADALAESGLDSLAFAELMAQIEDEFQVKLDDDVIDCETVGELASMVRQSRPAGRAERQDSQESGRPHQCR